MRFRTETPTGKPSWDVSVCLTGDAARMFLEMKACLINSGQYTTDSWVFSQLLANSYQRNHCRKTFRDLTAAGSDSAFDALTDMERLRILPPQYQPLLDELRRKRGKGGPPESQ